MTPMFFLQSDEITIVYATSEVSVEKKSNIPLRLQEYENEVNLICVYKQNPNSR